MIVGLVLWALLFGTGLVMLIRTRRRIRRAKHSPSSR